MVWINYNPSMMRRIYAAAEKCLPPEDKRCEATGAKLDNPHKASSEYGMAARRTHAAVCRESAKVKGRTKFCASRAATSRWTT